MHVFYAPEIELANELPDEEASHALRVLRLRTGDTITVTDGKGYFYEAKISTATNRHVGLTILKKEYQQPLWEGHIHLAVSPTKNMDRMEWLAEKATEIGMDELTFLNCQYSERKVLKTDRIEKILVSAIKQSLKARLPKLNGMTAFSDFVRQDFKGQKYIAHCYQEDKLLLQTAIQPKQDALVLIGPEGDFSPEEVALAMQNGFQPISLGPSRLRTETAALAACLLMNIANQINP